MFVRCSRQNFTKIARRFTKLKPNEIFNDFAISRHPIDDFFFLFQRYELWLRSHEDLRSCSRIKVLFIITCCANKIINLIPFSFEKVDKMSNLSNFEADRTNIADKI